MSCIQTIACLILTSSAAAVAADWPQWRGPQRNGVVEEGPSLATSWPEAGPRRVWLSQEEILGGNIGNYSSGGYGSVSVAEGRVYCCFVVSRREKIASRTLTERGLTRLGWMARKPPADILAAVERARVSPQRQALETPRDFQTWSRKWIGANLSADQRKQFSRYVLDRLKRGKDATSIELLGKLAAVKGKPFASQNALDAWLTENKVAGELRKRVQAQFPDTEVYRDTVVVCMNAATGKTVWKKLFRGGRFLPIYENVPSSGTPCVANGKVYLLGTNVEALCLDAKTGEKVWSAKIGSGKQRDSHCSFIVADGVAAASAQPLIGFDAETGKVLWTHEDLNESWSSPVLWRKDGREYFVFRDGTKVVCVAPRSGTILWSVKDISRQTIFSGSTPAVEGDRMVLRGTAEVRCYKLSLQKAEQVWKAECPREYCCSPTIYDGHVYVFSRGGAACINLASGKTVWQDKEIKAGSYHSPILADGKFFLQGVGGGGSSFGDRSLIMVAVSPEKGQLLGRAKIGQVLCTSAAMVDGRIFCRLRRRVACYDLRRQQN